MKVRKYIDYNEVLSQLQLAQIERDWDLIINLIQSLEHFIALEGEQQMLQQYEPDELNLLNIGD